LRGWRKLGFEAYSQRDIGEMVQQETSLHDGQLLKPGSARLGARRGSR